MADDRGLDQAALGLVEWGFGQLGDGSQVLGIDVGETRGAPQRVPAIGCFRLDACVGQRESIRDAQPPVELTVHGAHARWPVGLDVASNDVL